MQPIVELKDVCKDYIMGDATIHALNHVDFTLSQGDFVAVKGPSGSGKTTLLNMLGCVDTPTSGKVMFDRKDTSGLNDRQLSAIRFSKVGFIFQTFDLIQTLTVEENILMGLAVGPANLRRPLGSYDREIGELIEMVGLQAWRGHNPSQLSGGQRQRVAIARALVKKPSIILADEPTANLDSKNALLIVDLMKRLNKETGTAFLFSSHDASLMKEVDGLYEIHDGVISKKR